MTELIQLIEKWGEDRNFYSENGTTPEHQFVKLIEEFGENAGRIARAKSPKDDIGDQFVVLTNIARLCDLSLTSTRFSQVLNYDFQLEEFNDSLTLQEHIIFLTIEIGDLGRAILSRKSAGPMGIYNLNCAAEKIITRLKRIAKAHGLTLLECVQHSYDEIKDRKGKMVNSTFIKETDL